MVAGLGAAGAGRTVCVLARWSKGAAAAGWRRTTAWVARTEVAVTGTGSATGRGGRTTAAATPLGPVALSWLKVREAGPRPTAAAMTVAVAVRLRISTICGSYAHGHS